MYAHAKRKKSSELNLWGCVGAGWLQFENSFPNKNAWHVTVWAAPNDLDCIIVYTHLYVCACATVIRMTVGVGPGAATAVLHTSQAPTCCFDYDFLIQLLFKPYNFIFTARAARARKWSKKKIKKEIL